MLLEDVPRHINIYKQDTPKVGRGHATLVHPVQKAKCWRLLNLNHVMTLYDVV